MKIGNRDLNKEVLVIAEIGNNHEGKFEVAERMIHEAAQAGAQVVKFQTFKTELYINPSQSERFARLKSFELSFSQFEQLKKICDRAGVMFLSTPFDLESAKFLAEIAPAFKIGSGENTFYPLLEAVAVTGKPIIMSSGLSDLALIKRSKEFIEQVWNKKGVKGDLAVLHCVTNYPVVPENAHLQAITVLKEALGCTVGFSDHTLGLEAPLLAVALGARIIEKHFTLDKNFSDFRDHKISVDPSELKQLVELIKKASVLLGSAQKIVLQSETDLVGAVRRSIVAKRNLPAGHKISLEDITWTRPSGGFAPGQEDKVIDHLTTRPLSCGEIILSDVLRK